MKRINKKDYHPGLGKLIDVRHPLDYEKINNKVGVNIYSEKIMYNPSKYLNKTEKYYFICAKGTLSFKVVRQLEYLGYDVTLVEN